MELKEWKEKTIWRLLFTVGSGSTAYELAPPLLLLFSYLYYFTVKTHYLKENKLALALFCDISIWANWTNFKIKKKKPTPYCSSSHLFFEDFFLFPAAWQWSHKSGYLCYWPLPNIITGDLTNAWQQFDMMLPERRVFLGRCWWNCRHEHRLVDALMKHCHRVIICEKNR